jgi:hypothetical protein
MVSDGHRLPSNGGRGESLSSSLALGRFRLIQNRAFAGAGHADFATICSISV